MRVGQVLKSKAGKTYLKFEKNVTISEGEALFISTPQQEADEKLAKVPGFVLYNIKQVKNNVSTL